MASDINQKEREKNICMYCGRKSKNKMMFRVWDKKEVYRDFDSVACLVEYYKKVEEQEPSYY